LIEYEIGAHQRKVLDLCLGDDQIVAALKSKSLAGSVIAAWADALSR
jgi:hypothetical protein